MERREYSSKCKAAQNTEIYSPTNMCKHLGKQEVLCKITMEVFVTVNYIGVGDFKLTLDLQTKQPVNSK